MPKIIWKGNEYTNWSERTDDAGRSYIPLAIVDHISSGTMSSMDNWFTDQDNKISSAHFGVSKAGEIHQYVDIRKMAWANGATADTYAPAGKLAQIVADHYGVNPNLYTVSIEHEGTDGTLTEAQFSASVWLHGYIRDQIAEIYGEAFWFDLDAYHVIGHYQVSRLKPECPGSKFPWSRLYHTLKESDEPMLPVDVANNIIDSYLSPAWINADQRMKEAATPDETEEWRKVRDWQHYLADELRRASGQIAT